jgi:hypothetical protein
MNRWASIPLGLFSIFLLACNIGIVSRAGSIDSTSLQNSNAAMDKAVPQKVTVPRMRFKQVLFITNRKIDMSAEERARSDNSVLRIEDGFSKKPAVSVSYGKVTISYPAHRKRGEQNYKSGSSSQNPFFHFSIVTTRLYQPQINLTLSRQNLTPKAACIRPWSTCMGFLIALATGPSVWLS